MVSGTVGPARRQWLEAHGHTSRFIFALLHFYRPASSGNMSPKLKLLLWICNIRSHTSSVTKPKDSTSNNHFCHQRGVVLPAARAVRSLLHFARVNGQNTEVYPWSKKPFSLFSSRTRCNFMFQHYAKLQMLC